MKDLAESFTKTSIKESATTKLVEDCKTTKELTTTKSSEDCKTTSIKESVEAKSVKEPTTTKSAEDCKTTSIKESAEAKSVKEPSTTKSIKKSIAINLSKSFTANPIKPFKPTKFMLPTSHYDKARADHAVNFIQQLKHTKGIWSGKPFKLLPWQEEIVRNVFGTIKENGYRQFNTTYIEVPKKNGKSELAAAVALYMLCADGEEGAEIYGCANDRQQSCIVFNVAKDMTMQCPALLKRMKILDSTKRMIFLPTRSVYQALSTEVASKFGYNVHACIFDELLGQPNRKLFDVMTKGSGAARKQPLNFVITTAGSDKTSICWEVHSKAVDILEGRKHDPIFYPVLYSAPTEADWTDPKVWRNANPSLGETVDEEFLKSSCESAKQNPAEEMQFRQFFLCQWTSTSVRWMPMEKWDACGSEQLTVNSEQSTAYSEQLTVNSEQLMTNCKDSTVGNEQFTKNNKQLMLNGRDSTVGSKQLTENSKQLMTNCKDSTVGNKQFTKNNKFLNIAERLKAMEKNLEGRVCYGGLDLSSTTDITAFVLVFPPQSFLANTENEINLRESKNKTNLTSKEDEYEINPREIKINSENDEDEINSRKNKYKINLENDEKYFVLPYFWIPKENIDLRVRRDHVFYDLWEKQGFLKTTEGNVVHYGFIESFIEELGKKYNIREIAFDRWGAVQMTQNLENLGFVVVPFGQGFKDMSPPTKELMKLVLEEKIAHCGHPVLRWMMDNIFIRTDPAGNIKPDKEKSTEKIDGAVATIMALDRAIRHQNVESISVYDDRGLLVI